ncbi:GNAT family N-acetyltransferase [uncultured Polaribacter sp.]|uniref:GNAT family N-acetyltransferase n=1 Tax=uncultured Polaribacter sp. TaxID=174711 RepID=UPI00260821F7|nr:GNAT family N-acetyltransferase [uncultured Polaribacter sp.]
MITIRKATTADATHIALLGRITYTESHGNYIKEKEDLLKFYEEYYSVSRIREEINDVENIFWIVFSDELPIGFAKLSLNISYTKTSEINSCKLQRLYVLNDFIGFKIGSQLQEIILKEAKDLNFKNIWLTAYYKNKKGIKFYKRYGFKEIGSIDFIVGKSNYPNLVFSKKL